MTLIKPCSYLNCGNEITLRSRTGLCKKHYSYLWKSQNSDKAAAHCRATYERKRDQYIKATSHRRTIARLINPSVKLRDSLRRRLNNAVKNGQKVGSAISDLGCSISSLKQRLESKFQPGMTWENYGKWHIDHIRPLSSFDLSDRVQLLIACNYVNLQPMWAKDNLRKSNG